MHTCLSVRVRGKVNLRVIWPESTVSLRIMPNRTWLLKLPHSNGNEGVLGRRLIQRVRHPRVPAGLDVRGVEVVLGVINPAGSKRQFLRVLIVLVAVAVGAYEAAVFGIT